MLNVYRVHATVKDESTIIFVTGKCRWKFANISWFLSIKGVGWHTLTDLLINDDIAAPPTYSEIRNW